MLAVIGYGMWTAAGHDGPSSVASMRAGLSAAIETPLWDPTKGATLNAFQLSSHQWWEGESFLAEIATEVISQCHAQIDAIDGTKPEEVPILISVAPETRPGRTPGLEQGLLARLTAQLGFDLPEGSGILPGGKAAIPALLTNASALLGRSRYVILLGVESLLQQAIVNHYIRENRLLCGGNSSGFIPGEAGAAVILSAPGATGLPELRLTGVGEGREPIGNPDDETPRCSGLTNAMRSALATAGTQMFDIGVLLGDLNGEHGKFKEATVAVMRNDRLPPEGVSRRPRQLLEDWNTAEAIGEVGAAMLPAAMGWAFEAGRMGILPMRHVLFHGGEDDGTRVAIVGEFSG
ncbi:3-oxoacyl-ACP synthase [Marivivens marinus]|uniref:3-oxoacyl-ACP synthase n=1 Tax=Marivivens marinus TaxID=3110173 RepID=UPI003B849FC0